MTVAGRLREFAGAPVSSRSRPQPGLPLAAFRDFGKLTLTAMSRRSAVDGECLLQIGAVCRIQRRNGCRRDADLRSGATRTMSKLANEPNNGSIERFRVFGRRSMPGTLDDRSARIGNTAASSSSPHRCNALAQAPRTNSTGMVSLETASRGRSGTGSATRTSSLIAATLRKAISRRAGGNRVVDRSSPHAVGQ